MGNTLFGARSFGSSGTLYTIDPETGAVLGSLTVTLDGNPIYGMNGLATNPDTGELWGIFRPVLVGGPRYLGILDLSTGDATSVGMLPDNFSGIAFIPDPVTDVTFEDTWSPDGTMVAFGVRIDSTEERAQEIWIADLVSGTFQLVVSGNGVGWPEWSPDGRRLAYNSQGQVVCDGAHESAEQDGHSVLGRFALVSDRDLCGGLSLCLHAPWLRRHLSVHARPRRQDGIDERPRQPATGPQHLHPRRLAELTA